MTEIHFTFSESIHQITELFIWGVLLWFFASTLALLLVLFSLPSRPGPGVTTTITGGGPGPSVPVPLGTIRIDTDITVSS